MIKNRCSNNERDIDENNAAIMNLESHHRERPISEIFYIKSLNKITF